MLCSPQGLLWVATCLLLLGSQRQAAAGSGAAPGIHPPAPGRRLRADPPLTPSGRVEHPSELANTPVDQIQFNGSPAPTPPSPTGPVSPVPASPSPAAPSPSGPTSPQPAIASPAQPQPPPSPGPVEGGGCSVQEGIDFRGGDLPQPQSIKEGVNSAADCCTACQQTPGCGAFTWGKNEGRNRCFLKRPTGWISAPDPNLTSGTVPGAAANGAAPPAPGGQTINSPDGSCTAEPGTNLRSGDLAVKTGVNSAIDCCALCHRTDACGAWTWGESAGELKCFLKLQSGWTREPNANLTSGTTT